MRVRFTLMIGFLHTFLCTSAFAAGTTKTVAVVSFGDGSCDPVVKTVLRADKPDAAVSRRLKALFEQDQAGRLAPKIDWAKLVPQDRRRRLEVNALLKRNRLYSAADFYHAAMVFQHGNCPAHYRLARQLADEAVKLGARPARWLYAAATDRYLRSLNRPQKYGTQYLCNGEKAELQPYDPATTDAERAKYGVPTLKEILHEAKMACP